jgi:hypothetical protein
MLEDKYLIVKLTIAALILALASPALAELKTSYTASGNNVGLVVGAGGQYGGPLRSSNHQFPRGSGNFYSTGRWNWGVHVARDADGDGTAEDTVCILSRGGNVTGGNNSLESIAQITALGESGATMSEAVGKREVNPLYVSTDADDLANWPPEFREGRSASGAPILHGAETIASRFGDCFVEVGIGQSVEYQFYFMNFGESNDMVYMHVFFRNMSEYVKWHDNPDVKAKVANTPDGQVWKGMEQFYCTANGFRAGGRDEAWAYYFPKQLIMIADRDGVESGFTGHPAAMCYYQSRNAHLRDEVLELTNTLAHGWNSEFGFSSVEVMEGGYPMNDCYRYGLGENAPAGAYHPDDWNPYTESAVYGWPGVLDPEDTRYEQWIWGERNANNNYNFWSEFHDVMPRDSFSIDAVIMFVHLANEPFAWPHSQDLANLDDPAIGVALAPLIETSDVSDIVAGGGFILPETPIPPPLTIIPGDRMVTITWSDVNVNTPDAYYDFLEEYGMNDAGHYQKYDFEGYRLYRSFVGPNDSHSELIFECSLSEGDLTFFYNDVWDKDEPYYRLMNGMKVWYAMVPYDINYDNVSGASFSLPELASGKVWNRPGSGLYTVEPRSDASEFIMATGSAVYIGDATIDEGTVELAGDGSGKLTEIPKYLVPQLDISFEVVNNERIATDQTCYVACTAMDVNWGCAYWAYPGRVLSLLDANNNVIQTAPSFNTRSSTAGMTFTNTPDDDGVNYAVNVAYAHVGDTGSRDYANVYVDFATTYTGASIENQYGSCQSSRIGTVPSIGAFMRNSSLVVTWKASGDGLTCEVYDQVRGQTIPFSPYREDDAWGFMPGGTYSDYTDELKDGVSKADRASLLLETIAADNADEFAICLNSIVWAFVDLTAMPTAGTVMTVTTAFGDWNGDQTVFTQYTDAPWLGEKWQVNIVASTMDAEDADLSKIRVVPNPYLASSFLDLSPDSRRIEFINLPSRCTIRIYSMGGHLVNVLNHIGANRHGWGNYDDWDRLDSNNDPKPFAGHDNHSGTEPWNLRNRFGQTVASGLYFYHVTDQRGEEQVGRFYVVN